MSSTNRQIPLPLARSLPEIVRLFKSLGPGSLLPAELELLVEETARMRDQVGELANEARRNRDTRSYFGAKQSMNQYDRLFDGLSFVDLGEGA